eukprot:TRINITY_DN58_c0_g1_i1.p1 TRINITY_DN58_c0_g1~~TRINITY_DN58_c0_g1_i1.p1  ORF type:complete len:310 (+),score=14.03 TRINITY_DN58_c0_g1_i1:129-1058(+)
MAQNMAVKQNGLDLSHPEDGSASRKGRCQISQEGDAFGEGDVRDARRGYERREAIGGAIERSYFPGSFLSVSGSASGSSCNCLFGSCCCGNGFDVHSNGYQTHPVDVLAKAVEAEGIRQLLVMMKKKELLFLCEQSTTEVIDKDDKRQIILLLSEAWLLRGSKKFLKQIKGETPLLLICKHLGLPYSPTRKATVELVLRQINVIGLEAFSKRLRDEQVKGYFIGKAHDQTQQIQKIAADAAPPAKHDRKHREADRKSPRSGRSHGRKKPSPDLSKEPLKGLSRSRELLPPQQGIPRRVVGNQERHLEAH